LAIEFKSLYVNDKRMGTIALGLGYKLVAMK